MVLSPLSGGIEPKAFFEFGIRKPTIMIERKIPVTEDELHAYVDNELPAERRDDVEAWLAAHPGDAEGGRARRSGGRGRGGERGAGGGGRATPAARRPRGSRCRNGTISKIWYGSHAGG